MFKIKPVPIFEDGKKTVSHVDNFNKNPELFVAQVNNMKKQKPISFKEAKKMRRNELFRLFFEEKDAIAAAELPCLIEFISQKGYHIYFEDDDFEI
jgi:type IV secretory pathway VirB9-like protein